MKALLKYEFRKTWAAKAMVLGVTAVAELVFLAGLYIGKNENLTFTGIALLVMCASVGIVTIGLQSVLVLHRDMNTKQGYMLYMTPNSCYKTLGAKVIENGLSLLLAGAFFFALASLDVTLLFTRYGQLQDLIDLVKRVLQQLGQEIDLSVSSFAALSFSMMASWMCTVCAGYLADVVSSALLNGKRFNGLLSFLLFLLVMTLVGWVQRLPNYSDYMSAFMWQASIALVLAVGMYFLTAWVMERYLSV